MADGGGGSSGGGPRDPAFEEELAALRKAFGRKLPARIDEVAAALDAARGSRPGGEAYLVARRLAHNLHGSAASYGFAPVSAEMQRVVDGLDALSDSSGADAESLWSSIERALEQARSEHAASEHEGF
jgi:HPt (histidine-containing phosphotransfer) domain-containing protein